MERHCVNTIALPSELAMSVEASCIRCRGIRPAWCLEVSGDGRGPTSSTTQPPGDWP
jgi:hypothetical protein